MAQRADGGGDETLHERVARLMNAGEVSLVPVSTDWGLTVYRATTQDGRAAVKAGRPLLPGHVETEARMLRDLAATPLPAPRVIAVAGDILVMEWVDHDDEPARPIHERAAGEIIAALHAVPRPCFGYGYATQFGALAQPNDPAQTWIAFFRDRRLLHFARAAHRSGILDHRMLARIDSLAGRLDGLIGEPAHPALLHGDLWSGNMLIRGRRIAAFIDPALFHGHPEYELAYVTFHGTFGTPFFEAYEARLPIDPGFRQKRRDIYLIVPLLQHAMLSGPLYLYRIDRILARIGF